MSFVLSLSQTALRELIQSNRPGRIAYCPVGFCRRTERIDWLVHAVRDSPPDPDNETPHVLVRLLGSPAEFRRSFSVFGRLGGEIRLGIGAAAGQFQAMRYDDRRAIAFDEVRIVGPGMPTFGQPAAEVSAEDHEQWSRTIGVMGERAWGRLHRLHVAIIGCGRSGAIAAAALAQNGVGTLTLIDADVVERHNLGEMPLVSRADLGKPKSQALAEALSQRQGTRLHVCAAEIGQLPAILQASTADVLVGCVDNAAARLATAITAVLYLKPLLDIGTGILRENAAWGADVRLVLPGRCLLCLGGIADMSAGLAELFEGRAVRSADWRMQRRGSLHSLNALAVYLGLRLFEEWLMGRRQQSTWLHLEGTPAGIPQLETRAGLAECLLCQRTGQGDEAVASMRDLLRRSAGPSARTI